jgi:hypothetical protein
MNLITLASNAVSMSVPAGVAVAEGYTYGQYRRLGVPAAVAGWAELGSGALAFATLAAVGLTGSVIAGGPAEGILLPILSVVAAGSFAAAGLFRHPHVLTKAIDWIDRHIRRHRRRQSATAVTRVRFVSDELGHVRPSMATWMMAFGLSLANWLLDVASLVLVFLATGGPVPLGSGPARLRRLEGDREHWDHPGRPGHRRGWARRRARGVRDRWVDGSRRGGRLPGPDPPRAGRAGLAGCWDTGDRRSAPPGRRTAPAQG